MNQDSVKWIGSAILSLGLAGISFILGSNLVPTMADAQEKQGSLVPWMLIWGMIWITAVSAVALACFLIVSAVKEIRRSDF